MNSRAARWWIAAILVLAAGCAPRGTDAPFAAVAPDGVLDCGDAQDWVIDGWPDVSAEGFSSAEAALVDALAGFLNDPADLTGPHSIDDNVASLLNAQNREVVVASVVEVSPGSWFLTTLSGCAGFERF